MEGKGAARAGRRHACAVQAAAPGGRGPRPQGPAPPPTTLGSGWRSSGLTAGTSCARGTSADMRPPTAACTRSSGVHTTPIAAEWRISPAQRSWLRRTAGGGDRRAGAGRGRGVSGHVCCMHPRVPPLPGLDPPSRGANAPTCAATSAPMLCPPMTHGSSRAPRRCSMADTNAYVSSTWWAAAQRVGAAGRAAAGSAVARLPQPVRPSPAATGVRQHGPAALHAPPAARPRPRPHPAPPRHRRPPCRRSASRGSAPRAPAAATSRGRARRTCTPPRRATRCV
jgi:hypothetical protein